MSRNKFGLMIYVVHPRAASTKDRGRWDVYEEVYIKNGLRKSLATSASIILDCESMTVYKDRTNPTTPRSFDEYIDYLAKNHRQVAEYKEIYDQYKKYIRTLEQQATAVDVQGVDDAASVEEE